MMLNLERFSAYQSLVTQGTDIMKAYLRRDMLQRVIFNPGALNPYHGSQHIALVVYHTYAGLVYAGASEDDLRLGVVAAAFHDYAHSGGVHDDNTNIPRAISAVAQYAPSEGSQDTADSVYSLEFFRSVYAAIRCTKFLHGKAVQEPTRFVEKALRDADMCMLYTEEGRRVLMGLRNENREGIQRGHRFYKYAEAADRKEYNEIWLTKVEEFQRNAEMFTEYGTFLKETYLESALQDLRRMVAEEEIPY